jgi:hypothetical protein
VTAPSSTSGLRRFVLQLLEIMRLRSGPQDLPAGWGISFLLAVLYMLEGLMADYMLSEADAAPRSLVSVSIQFLAIAALLRLRRFSVRLPQTITALSGTGLVFGALSIALALQASAESVQPLLVLVWISAFVWSLVVDAHIYRRALSINMNLGILVAVLIFALNFVVLEQFFTPEQIQG